MHVLPSIIDGLLIGFVYGVAAMGLTLIWGVMRVINLAHGATMALGMFCTYFLFSDLAVNPYLGMVAVVVLALMFGFLIYGVALQRVIQAGYLSTLLATFAVNMIIIGIGTTVFTTSPRNIDFSAGSITLGPVILQGTRLLAALAAVVMTAALYLFLYFTRPGKAIRAVADNRAAAELMGIPSSHDSGPDLRSGHHAGRGGRRAHRHLLSLYHPERRHLPVEVLCHLRSGRPRQSLGGPGGGPDSGGPGGGRPHLHAGELGAGGGIRPLRPGPGGQAHRAVGSQVDELLASNRASGSMFSWSSWAGLVILVLRQDTLRETAFTVLMFIGLASSLNILMGYTGYVNFGHIVFFGLGGYFGFYLLSDLGLAGLPGGPGRRGPVGGDRLIIGAAVLRLRGAYFALATIGVNEAARAFVSNFEPFGGSTGLVRQFFGLRPYGGAGPALWLIFTLLWLVALTVIVVSYLVKHSRFGLGLIAIREDEDTAMVMGVKAPWDKTKAFMLCRPSSRG